MQVKFFVVYTYMIIFFLTVMVNVYLLNSLCRVIFYITYKKGFKK